VLEAGQRNVIASRLERIQADLPMNTNYLATHNFSAPARTVNELRAGLSGGSFGKGRKRKPSGGWRALIRPFVSNDPISAPSDRIYHRDIEIAR
jgi:hypothetical protein